MSKTIKKHTSGVPLNNGCHFNFEHLFV